MNETLLSKLTAKDMIEVIAAEAITNGAQSAVNLYKNSLISWRRAYFTETTIDESDIYDADAIELLITDVCRVFKIKATAFKSGKREAVYVHCRIIVSYISYVKGFGSFKSIGTEIGGRDHTTIMNHRNKFKNYYETKDAKFMGYWRKYLQEGLERFTKEFIAKLETGSEDMPDKPTASNNIRKPPAVYSNKTPFNIINQITDEPMLENCY